MCFRHFLYCSFQLQIHFQLQQKQGNVRTLLYITIIIIIIFFIIIIIIIIIITVYLQTEASIICLSICNKFTYYIQSKIHSVILSSDHLNEKDEIMDIII